jgi:general secretion pathway protein G
MKNKIKKQGFTLIELIVVMTIIAVITVLAVVSFSGTNKKARDARRISDLEKLRVALEMAKQVGSTYPVASGGLPTGLVPSYIQALPDDPKSFSYFYNRDTNYHYYLYAQMEDVSSTNTICASYPSSCGGLCNYCVSSP